MNDLTLSKQQISDYKTRGVLFPLHAISGSEVTRLRGQFDAYASFIKGDNNQKPHLLFTWLDQLVRDPRIVEPVAQLLGPNILCWGSQFFSKQPGDARFVSWHQDATYWGLSDYESLTAWIALSPSTHSSGCMRVVIGSHEEQLPHTDLLAENNMLSRGQQVHGTIDHNKVVNVELSAGDFSVHHVLLVHGSEMNRSNEARIGFAIRYVSTRVRQLSPIRDSAQLVLGTDEFGHFDAEVRPETDLHPSAVARHTAIVKRQHERVRHQASLSHRTRT